jgi:hypothetical protein
MMSGVPLKTCWAFNKLWNNKFYYKYSSCWHFYWVHLLHQIIQDEKLLLMHLRLNALCLLLVSHFNQYCSRSKSLSKEFTSGILGKSIRRESRYFMQTNILKLAQIENRKKWKGKRGSAVGWGTALQARRSRGRFPMVSLEFFIDIIFPTALCPWGWLSL